jgi:hypothetical protein
LIHRRHWEISLFVADLVAQVLLVVVPRVPKTLFRIDVIITVVLRLVEPNIVEDEKLDLRSPITNVRHPARL